VVGNGWVKLEAAVAALEESVGSMVPEYLGGDSAVVGLQLFAPAGKVADAGQALVARQIEASNAYVSRGHKTAAALVATAGLGMERAAVAVEVGRRLVDQPLTDQAFRRGDPSLDQAGLISEAVEAAPDAEARLLDVASRETVRRLRKQARDVRLDAEGDREAVHARQRARQEFRHGRGRDGMVWGQFRLPAETGVPLINRVEEETDRLYRGADRATRHVKTHSQFAAEALCRLVAGEAKPSSGRAEVVLHVSYAAIRRGYLEPGEACRLESGDDVPLSVARELLDGNAFINGVQVDGTDVRKVKHFGRRISAALKAALLTEAMLRDGEVRCSVPGCDRTQGLEWHHIQPHARGGPTSIQNLEPRCPHDHRREHAGAGAPGSRGRPPP
jgi:hypothetical protein